MKGIVARLRALFMRRAADRELDEEIRFHLEQEAAKYEREGVPPAEARRRALVAFGGVAQATEAHRAVRGVPWAESLAADARYALRTMRRTPVLTGAAIITLALGVGANTAIYTAVNAVVLRPLPFPAPDRLFMLWEENPEKGWHKQVAAPANVLDWREQVAAFQDVAAYSEFSGTATLTGHGDPRVVGETNVTGNFFSVLGARAALGRTLRDEETWQGGSPVAVISHRLWRDHFGSDPAVVGREVRIDGRAVQIVGIMPEGFSFPSERIDLWKPTGWDPASRTQIFFRRAHWMRPIARLRPGVTPAEADAQLQAVVRRLQQQYPETNRVMGAGMTPLQEFLLGDTRLPLIVLLGAVGLLLLIACANVGNLLLVQAAGRERETAVRLALGAGRARLVRQAFTESLVLALLGGAAGLALGWAGTRALQALQPAGMLRVSEFAVDWHVLAYVLAITTASGILFGIAPALWNRRRLPAEALKDGGRGGSDGRRMRRWWERLVVVEVGLAVLLSVGAGLLVRSFLRLQEVNPGFESRGVITGTIELPGVRYDSAAKVDAFFDELLRRTRALPGVEGAALVSALPLMGNGWTSDFVVAGRASDEYGSEVAHRKVSVEYLRVMRVPILAGRGFTDEDRGGAPPVVLVNQRLAREHFRGENPIGQRIAFDRTPDSSSTWFTIVGVVGDEHQNSLAAEPMIEALDAFAQNPTQRMTLVARSRGEPAVLAPALRRIVADLDPGIVVQDLQPMETVRARSLALQRFLTMLLFVFASTGLVLAVVGVYGVMSQLARRRTREMGIRIALGARASEVRWLVVRQGLRLVLFGLVVGTGGALMATQTIRALLFRVAPSDPLTFVAVPALLALTGLLAAWLPAIHASRADPVRALREE